MRLAGLAGSALEHEIFESEFSVESISADKGLGLARQAGIEVLEIDAGNLGSSLPLLNHPQAVVDDVVSWVESGRVVEVPRQPLTHVAWQGSVWRAEDPASGASGYFLAGGLAGGSTAEEPEDWVLEFLADALQWAISGGSRTWTRSPPSRSSRCLPAICRRASSVSCSQGL